MTDTDSRIVFANKAFIEISGYTLEEMLGQPHNLVRHPDVPAEVFADMWATLQAGQSWSGLLKNRCKNDNYYWVQAHASPVRRGGKLVGYMSVRTKPRPKQVETVERIYQLIREGQAKSWEVNKGTLVRSGVLGWLSLFKFMPVPWRIRLTCCAIALGCLIGVLAAGVGGLALATIAGGIGLATLLGSLALESQLARPIAKLLAQAQALASGQPKRMTDLDRTDEIGMLKRTINQSGLNLLALLGNVSPQAAANDDDRDLHAQGNDLALTAFGQIVHAVNKMENSLRFDRLTGVYNRAFLIEQAHVLQQKNLKDSMGVPAVHALLFIDLDRFKAVNDSLGHAVGDQVLTTVARRLEEVVRTEDIVARYGGDEFCILLKRIGVTHNVHVIADKIRAALEQAINIENGAVYIGASIGWATLGDDGDNIDALLRVADQRMLEVKHERKAAGAAPSDKTLLNDESQRYGKHWASVLTPFTEALQPHAAAIVDQFYAHLARRANSKHLIETLSAPELRHLKSRQMRNLFALASPDLTEETHRGMALRVGRIHAIVGLLREDLVSSHDLMHTVIRRYMDTVTHGEAISLIARRKIRDLAWQTEAYQHMQSQRQALLLDITRVSWEADSYTDLISQASEILGSHEEIAGCTFSRPDEQGVFRFEAIAGKNIENLDTEEEQLLANLFPTMAGDPARGQSPTSRAWASATVEHCINLATDPRMQVWQELAQRTGIRSSAAIPLCQPGHAPAAILTLFSAFPGGYSSADHMALVTQLQTLLAFAIMRLEHKEGYTHAMPYTQRWHLTSLLRSGSLEMHYQPILSIRTGQVIKVEALARLRDGARIITPGEFFPAFSRDDFLELYALGLKQALEQLNRWLRDGLDIGISVNLPASGLADLRYFEATRQALHECATPTHRVTIEILETDEIPPASVQSVADVLDQFKALGVNLAEDDLGAGHSGLSRLRKLPFDIIKIDRSIVTLTDANPSDVLHFIYQLTRLGHSLGKLVIAEGVEDRGLLEAARILGVDAIQGYVIARPMPAQELTQWMQKEDSWDDTPPLEVPKLLAELARLLLWEELMQLHHENMPVNTSYIQGMTGQAIPSPLLRHVDQAEQLALASAAHHHGLHSPEYLSARGQLVAELAADRH